MSGSDRDESNDERDHDDDNAMGGDYEDDFDERLAQELRSPQRSSGGGARGRGAEPEMSPSPLASDEEPDLEAIYQRERVKADALLEARLSVIGSELARKLDASTNQRPTTGGQGRARGQDAFGSSAAGGADASTGGGGGGLRRSMDLSALSLGGAVNGGGGVSLHALGGAGSGLLRPTTAGTNRSVRQSQDLFSALDLANAGSVPGLKDTYLSYWDAVEEAFLKEKEADEALKAQRTRQAEARHLERLKSKLAARNKAGAAAGGHRGEGDHSPADALLAAKQERGWDDGFAFDREKDNDHHHGHGGGKHRSPKHARPSVTKAREALAGFLSATSSTAAEAASKALGGAGRASPSPTGSPPHHGHHHASSSPPSGVFTSSLLAGNANARKGAFPSASGGESAKPLPPAPSGIVDQSRVKSRVDTRLAAIVLARLAPQPAHGNQRKRTASAGAIRLGATGTAAGSGASTRDRDRIRSARPKSGAMLSATGSASGANQHLYALSSGVPRGQDYKQSLSRKSSQASIGFTSGSGELEVDEGDDQGESNEVSPVHAASAKLPSKQQQQHNAAMQRAASSTVRAGAGSNMSTRPSAGRAASAGLMKPSNQSVVAAAERAALAHAAEERAAKEVKQVPMATWRRMNKELDQLRSRCAELEKDNERLRHELGEESAPTGSPLAQAAPLPQGSPSGIPRAGTQAFAHRVAGSAANAAGAPARAALQRTASATSTRPAASPAAASGMRGSNIPAAPNASLASASTQVQPSSAKPSTNPGLKLNLSGLTPDGSPAHTAAGAPQKSPSSAHGNNPLLSPRAKCAVASCGQLRMNGKPYCAQHLTASSSSTTEAAPSNRSLLFSPKSKPAGKPGWNQVKSPFSEHSSIGDESYAQEGRDAFATFADEDEQDEFPPEASASSSCQAPGAKVPGKGMGLGINMALGDDASFAGGVGGPRLSPEPTSSPPPSFAPMAAAAMPPPGHKPSFSLIAGSTKTYDYDLDSDDNYGGTDQDDDSDDLGGSSLREDEEEGEQSLAASRASLRSSRQQSKGPRASPDLDDDFGRDEETRAALEGFGRSGGMNDGNTARQHGTSRGTARGSARPGGAGAGGGGGADPTPRGSPSFVTQGSASSATSGTSTGRQPDPVSRARSDPMVARGPSASPTPRLSPSPSGASLLASASNTARGSPEASPTAGAFKGHGGRPSPPGGIFDLESLRANPYAHVDGLLNGSFEITQSGTFKRGGFAINREGFATEHDPSASPSSTETTARSAHSGATRDWTPVTARPGAGGATARAGQPAVDPLATTRLPTSRVASIGSQASSTASTPSHASGSASSFASASGSSGSVPSTFRSLNVQDLYTLGVLGRGSSGVVYRSFHAPSMELLAVKAISIHESDKRKQLTAELRTLTLQPNPFTIGFRGAYFDAQHIYIALEYMDGGSLDDLMRACEKDGGPVGMSELELAFAYEQVFLGLRHLHKQNIIHRDIKPHNILYNARGQCKLTDFGIISDLSEQSSAAAMAEARTFVGTLLYMSPERIGGQRYSYACDIWSTALAMLTCRMGEFAIPHQSHWELVNKIQAGPDMLKQYSSAQLSDSLRDLLAHCLRTDPADRPTAAECLRHPFFAKFRSAGPNSLIPLPSGFPRVRSEQNAVDSPTAASSGKARDRRSEEAARKTQQHTIDALTRLIVTRGMTTRGKGTLTAAAGGASPADSPQASAVCPPAARGMPLDERLAHKMAARISTILNLPADQVRSSLQQQHDAYVGL